MFVCETSTKKEIVQFLSCFIPAMFKYSDKLFVFIKKYKELNLEQERHQKILNEFINIRLKITDLKIDDPNDQRILNVFKILTEKISGMQVILPSVFRHMKSLSKVLLLMGLFTICVKL